MKLAMFDTVEEYVAWHNKQADLIEANGLKLAKEALAKARRTGVDVKWHEGNVRNIERKVKKYRKLAQQALLEA